MRLVSCTSPSRDVYAMTEDDLATLINQNIPSADIRMHIVIGYFLSCYSIGELGLTSILLSLSSATDTGKFATLCKGMDAKAKIRAIRELADQSGGLGPNLKDRLDYFHDKLTGKRNTIAHCAIRELSPGRYQALSHKALTDVELNFGRLSELGAQFTANELLSWARWLYDFGLDSGQVMAVVRAGKRPEIDSPLTALRPLPLPDPSKSKSATKDCRP